jgi:hypothetical protein
MSIPVALNLIGLLVALVAALLMYYFPPRLLQYTEKGEPVINWVANPDEKKKAIGRWQMRASKYAPLLLCLGFLIQLIALLISIREH